MTGAENEPKKESGPPRDLGHRSVTGLFWTTGSTVIIIVLQITVLAILARLLKPTDFGVASAAMLIVTFMSVFNEMGIAPSIVLIENLTQRHIRTGFTASLIIGMIFFTALFMGAPLVERFFAMPGLAGVCHIVAFIFLFNGAGEVANGINSRNLRFREIALTDAVSYAIAYIGIAVPMAYFGFRYYGLAAGALAQEIITMAAYNLIARHSMVPLFDWAAFREMTVLTGGFSLARFFNQIAMKGDNFVVGRVMGATALGLYDRTYQLVALMATLYGRIVDRVVFPAMTRLQNEPERLRAAFVRGTALTALVGVPVGAIVAILAPYIVILLLGPKWTGMIQPLAVLAYATYFRTGYRVSALVIRAKGYVYHLAILQGIYAAAVVIGAYVGARYGLRGVAFAVLGAIILQFVLLTAVALRLSGLGLREFIVAHRPAVALGTLIGAAAWLTVKLLAPFAGPIVVILAALAAVTCVGALAAVVARDFFFGTAGTQFLKQVIRIFQNYKNRLATDE